MIEQEGDALIAATVEVIRAALIEGKAIEVPYIGTFVVKHVAPSIRSDPDGELVIIPPRKTIGFSQSND